MLGTDESQSCWFRVSQSCYLRTGCLGFDQGWFGRKADAVFSPEQTTLWALPPPGLGMEERKQKSPLYVVVRNLTWPRRGKTKEPHCSSTLNALCRQQSTLTLRLVRTKKRLGSGQKQKITTTKQFLTLSAVGEALISFLGQHEVLHGGVWFEVSLQKVIETEHSHLAKLWGKEMNSA